MPRPRVAPVTRQAGVVDRWLAPDELPAIDGLVVRGYAGPADDAAVAAVMTAANEANGSPEVATVERLRAELANWSHLDPAEDLVLAFVGSDLVAVSQVEWSDTPDGDRHYMSLGHVAPAWRRRGLGSVLLTRAERRLAELARDHDVRGRRVLMAYLEEPDVGGLRLFASRGYTRVRVYRHMTRPTLDDIAMPALPRGLEVRPVGEGDLPRVWDAMMEAFRDHFGAHDASEAAYRRWVGDPSFDRHLLVIAFDGDEVAGGVAGLIDEAENESRGYRRGWTDPVFTRRAWRRRGLASALLGRALVRLRERGMTSAQLDVDTENANAALALYERHGFVVDHTSTEWHRPLDGPMAEDGSPSSGG